jgi:hypothetical protein
MLEAANIGVDVVCCEFVVRHGEQATIGIGGGLVDVLRVVAMASFGAGAVEGAFGLSPTESMLSDPPKGFVEAVQQFKLLTSTGAVAFAMGCPQPTRCSNNADHNSCEARERRRRLLAPHDLLVVIY